MRIYAACIALLLFAAACKKENSADTTKASLQGKWKVIGSYMSSGGPMYFVPAPVKPDYDYTIFNKDSTVTGNIFNGYIKYSLKDSTNIILTKADKTTYQRYYYIIRHDTLNMSPMEPVRCIEGCSTLFVKVK